MLMENLTEKMKRKSEKMRTALRAVALVLLLGAGLGQLAAQSLPDGKAGKNTREEEKPYYMDKTVNEDGNLLTLESYVKGKISTPGSVKPTDFCLVLDASSSMRDVNYTTMTGWLPHYNRSKFSHSDVTVSGNPYYFRWFDGTNEQYIKVNGMLGKVKNNQSTSPGNEYYLYTWIYFDCGENRYFLYDNSVIKAPAGATYSVSGNRITYPKDVDGNEIPTVRDEGSFSSNYSSKQLWTGSLYRNYTSGQVMPEEFILQEAVGSFLSSVRKNALENPDPTTHQPVRHRVSLVKFAQDLFYGDSYKGGDNVWLNENVYNHVKDLTEGTHGALASNDANPAVFSPNPTEVMSNFYKLDDIYDFNKMRARAYSMRAGDITGTNLGVKKAEVLFDDSYNPYNNGTVDVSNENKVMIVFTDGELTVNDNPHQANSHQGFNDDAANQAVNIAYQMKKKGYKVYTIGLFHQSSGNAVNLIKYMSSSFPDAADFGNPGSENDPQHPYYFAISNADELKNIFEKIAEESGAAVSWNEETVTRDVISRYFRLPAGTQASNIGVKTADCNGINDEGVLTFDTPLPYSHTDDDIELTTTTIVDEFGREVQCDVVNVKSFDFSENWCGIENGTPRGKKLIIEIPIEERPGIDPGFRYTNESGSYIIPNGDEEPTEDFPVPNYYVKGTTWVTAIKRYPGEENIKIINDTCHIYTKEGLAWFISMVCGYNDQEANPYAKAVLEADVDMTEGLIMDLEDLGVRKLLWVPIGGHGYVKSFESESWHWIYPSGHGFKGYFNGQGHTIRGMRNPDPISVPQVGMFGYVDGATIENVFIVNCEFIAAVGKTAEDNLSTGIEGHFGIIADTLCGGGRIFNCEAAGLIRTYDTIGKMFDDSEYDYLTSPSQDPTKCQIGGLVGLMGRNKQGEISPATVHSCISVANVMGYDMGGLAYEIASGSTMMNNYGYTAHLKLEEDYSPYLGGLVGLNAGTVENCYLRDRDNCEVQDATLTGIFAAVSNAGSDKSSSVWHKGLLAGLNNGTMTRIYVPEPWKNCPAIDVTNDLPCFVGYQSQAAQNVGWFTNAVTPYLYKHNDTKISMLPDNTLGDRLLQTLNAWVDSHAGCTHWMRTTAAGINDDYPVLKLTESNFPSCECVASDDQIVLFYGGINEMLGSRELMTDDKENASIYLYKSVALTEGDNGAKLYIDENVAVTQTENVNAYVGITLDNSAGINGANANNPNVGFVMDAIDWHMFATPLSNAPLGINYIDEGTSWPFSDTHGNMPYYRFFDESDGLQEHDGYFPSHIFGTEYGNGDPYVDNNGVDYYHAWDFYCWDEYSQHYINFKRNSDSHWTEGQDLNSGNLHQQIEYTNESTLKRGKGYLLAVADETFLQSHGKLNNGSFTHDVTYNENPFCKGYNLVGNPYQSYLDFDVFAETNGLDGYVIMDEDQADEQGKNAYLYYAKNSTTDPDLQFINMHQGFFIKVNENQTLTFTNDMRSLTANEGTHFRNESKKAYPYLRLFVSEDEGYGDYTTIEFNRPELGGGEKFTDLRAGNAQIFVHHGETSYSTLFATNDIKEVAVRFNTLANANFTMSWKFSEGDFNEMYLIDNLTGQKIDMLSHNEYKFEGHVSDYASRFKVVFATNGIDEETDEPDIFAFQMDGKLIVNGTGICQMFDVTGRLVFATELSDVQNALALPKTGGVYMLRLVNGNTAKVQKIVVK